MGSICLNIFVSGTLQQAQTNGAGPECYVDKLNDTLTQVDSAHSEPHFRWSTPEYTTEDKAYYLATFMQRRDTIHACCSIEDDLYLFRTELKCMISN